MDINISIDENDNECSLADMGSYLLFECEDDTETYYLKYEYINDAEVVIIDVE